MTASYQHLVLQNLVSIILESVALTVLSQLAHCQ